MSGGGKIADLVAKLDRVGSQEWRTSLCRQLAEKSLDLIDRGFQAQSNPYGDGWTETKQPNPILEKTGTMRGAFRITGASAAGFTIRNETSYAGFHQYGTSKLPVRAMTPTDAAGMPVSWEREYDGVLVRFVQETMR